MRDSLTLLDRMVAYTDGPVTEAATVGCWASRAERGLLTLVETLSKGRAAAIPGFVDQLLDRGQSLDRFLSDLLGLVRELVRLKLSGSGKQGDPALARCAGRFPRRTSCASGISCWPRSSGSRVLRRQTRSWSSSS